MECAFFVLSLVVFVVVVVVGLFGTLFCCLL